MGWSEGSITRSYFSNPRILVMRSKSSMLLFINDEISEILESTFASEFLSMKLLKMKYNKLKTSMNFYSCVNYSSCTWFDRGKLLTICHPGTCISIINIVSKKRSRSLLATFTWSRSSLLNFKYILKTIFYDNLKNIYNDCLEIIQRSDIGNNGKQCI